MAKEKGKRLDKKLAAYSVTAAAALAVAPAANAAIQYSGPQNLNVGWLSSQDIDMNVDGNYDFGFYVTSWYVITSTWTYHTTYSSTWTSSWGWWYYNAFMNHLTSGSSQINETVHNDPANLSAGYSVQASLSGPNYWAPYFPDTLNGPSSSFGNFYYNQGYIGVKFHDSNQACDLYGWIQYNGSWNGGTIVNWAYEDTCGTAIQAGDIGCTDTDGDLVCDTVDNCPTVANTNQADADADGVGDVCDICPGYDDTIDTDADGVPDGCDICPGFDDTIDTDLDGTPDGCDIDDDGDGIADTVEDAAPNGGDGNNDGIQDSLQSDVTSLPAALGGGYVTVDTNTVNCPLTNVSTVDEAALAVPDPDNRAYPYGLVQFTAGCSSANVETIWSSDLTGMFPRKTNQTLGTWFDMGAIAGNTISMTINDNGPEDNDVTANSAIADPQGPAGAVLPLPTMNEWGIIILAGLLSAIAIRAINREQEEA